MTFERLSGLERMAVAAAKSMFVSGGIPYCGDSEKARSLRPSCVSARDGGPSKDGHWQFKAGWESGVLFGSARRACYILRLRVHESSDRKHHRAGPDFLGVLRCFVMTNATGVTRQRLINYGVKESSIMTVHRSRLSTVVVQRFCKP